MDLVTRTVRGVELMRAGKWPGHGCPVGGCEFTTADLDSMVSAYTEAKTAFNAPVKLGHDDGQKLLQKDGYPAAGWVINLRRVGDALIGDLEKVPAKVADLIAAGAYRKRSSEIRPEAEINGKKFKYQFTGLALLGADLPAVEGLNDIMGLYHSLSLTADEKDNVLFFEGSKDEIVSFGDADEIDSIIAAMEALVERADRVIAGKRGAPRLRSLVATAKEELRRVAGSHKLSTRKDMAMDPIALRTLLGLPEDATDEQVMAKIKAALEAKPALSEDEKTELTQLRGDVLALQTERLTSTAETLVDNAIRDGKLLPAQREQSLSFAKADAAGFKKFVDSQPKVIELGERGSQDGNGDTVDLTALEPTTMEVQIAKDLGIHSADWRLNFMKTRADQKGITLPVDFGKEPVKA